jgi:hypothetical protein
MEGVLQTNRYSDTKRGPISPTRKLVMRSNNSGGKSKSFVLVSMLMIVRRGMKVRWRMVAS